MDPFDEFEDTGDKVEYSPGTIDVDSIDFERIADVAINLILAYLYHHSDDQEKLETLLAVELSAQEEYIKNSLYKPTIIRQATVIEYFLQAHLVQRFEEEKDGTLTNSEKQFIRHNLQSSGRHRLASILGILSEEEEQAISELISARNDIAHTPWILFTEDSEKRFERIATRMHRVFEDLVEYEGTMEELSKSVLEEFEDN